MFFPCRLFFFSAHAGWCADRFSKKRIVIATKLLELLAVCFGAYGIIFLNWPAIMVMVFILGLQTTLFAPALLGAIPELVPVEHVPRANAVLKLATTLAVLAGLAAAGFVLERVWVETTVPFGRILAACILLLAAALGVATSVTMPASTAPRSSSVFPWAGPVTSVGDLLALKKDRQLLPAIAAYAFFYFLASLTIFLINAVGLLQLHLSKTLTSLASVALMLGVCGGAFAAAKLSRRKEWFRIVPWAALGLAFGLMLCASVVFYPLFRLAAFWFFLVVTGFAGGLYFIPLASFIQLHPRPGEKGRIIALSKFCVFCGVLLAGELFQFLDTLFPPSTLLFGAGLLAFIWSFLLLRTRPAAEKH